MVSLGQQTFASKRVRRSPPEASDTAAGSARARFAWHEGTDVVLQRGGASMAQVSLPAGDPTLVLCRPACGPSSWPAPRASASPSLIAGLAPLLRTQIAIYKAGRVDGALGDRLQVGSQGSGGCQCSGTLRHRWERREAGRALLNKLTSLQTSSLCRKLLRGACLRQHSTIVAPTARCSAVVLATDEFWLRVLSPLRCMFDRPPLTWHPVQCWCQLDLAGYFEGQPGGASAAPAAPAAPALQAEAPAPPPELLLTVAHTDSEASLASCSASELAEAVGEVAGEAGEARQQDGVPVSHPADHDGRRRLPGPGPASVCATASPAVAQAEDCTPDGDGAPPCSVQGGAAGLQRQGSGGNESGDGEVLSACWLPLVDPGDANRVLGRVRVTVRTSSPTDLEQQLWRRLLALADLDDSGALSAEEFEALLAVRRPARPARRGSALRLLRCARAAPRRALPCPAVLCTPTHPAAPCCACMAGRPCGTACKGGPVLPCLRLCFAAGFCRQQRPFSLVCSQAPASPALQAMGAELDAQEVAALFHQADSNGDGSVDADELAAVLTLCHADGELHRWGVGVGWWVVGWCGVGWCGVGWRGGNGGGGVCVVGVGGGSCRPLVRCWLLLTPVMHLGPRPAGLASPALLPRHRAGGSFP